MTEKSKKNIIDQPWFILIFITAICLLSGLILSTVSYVLQGKQTQAATFDKNQQLLFATQVLDYDNVFRIRENGSFIPAHFDTRKQILIPFSTDEKIRPSDKAAIELFCKDFIKPLLTDGNGNIFSLEEKNLTINDFKTGASMTASGLYLFYVLLNSTRPSQVITSDIIKKDPQSITAIMLPISGFGLWSPLYGFLAVETDGNTVLGASWYLQGETPGLGANITNPLWLQKFYNKKIFMPNSSGNTDFETAPLGLQVIKGSVAMTLGNSPKASVSVDGISGATLTCNGVTEAYSESLKPYRKLLIKIHTNATNK